MMLAGLPVAADSTAELASIVRAAGADELADRPERVAGANVEPARAHKDELRQILRDTRSDDLRETLTEALAVCTTRRPNWTRSSGSSRRSP